MNESILNPYTIITVLSFLAVFVLVAFFIRKKSSSLKKIINNKKLELSERFEAQLKLNKLPKNSAKIRIRNRCEVSGRPHGVYRKLKISRIALRDMASAGKIPGITKSSW